jgi:hypothetical protein
MIDVYRYLLGSRPAGGYFSSVDFFANQIHNKISSNGTHMQAPTTETQVTWPCRTHADIPINNPNPAEIELINKGNSIMAK